MNWTELFWIVLPYLLTVIAGVLAWYLNRQNNIANWHEAMAILLGDLVANVVAGCQGEIDKVDSATIYKEADLLYDMLINKLPQKWHDLIGAVITRIMVEQWAWGAWQKYRCSKTTALRVLPTR